MNGYEARQARVTGALPDVQQSHLTSTWIEQELDLPQDEQIYFHQIVLSFSWLL